MPIDERLRDLYRGVAVHASANEEHLAALELLVLVMLADDEITDAELDAVRAISDEWRGENERFEEQLRPAIERARRALESDQVTALLDDIESRIFSRVLRNALFSAAREVAGVDEHVTPVEGSILAEVAVRFD